MAKVKTKTEVNEYSKFNSVGESDPVVEDTPQAVPVPVFSTEPAHQEATTLNSGRELPKAESRPDADPLHLECLDLFRTLLAGGVIYPWAGAANSAVEAIITKLSAAVK